MLLQKTQVLQAVIHHLAVMAAQTMPFQSRHDLWNLGLRSAWCELRDLCRWRLAFLQRFQHQLTGDPENVRQGVAQFHVGILQDLVHTVAFAGPHPDHLAPPPRQIAQLAQATWRDETGPNHRMSQQMRQPPTVLLVRLMAFAILDLLRIGQLHLDAVFQHVEYGLPIRTRTLRPRG